MNIGVASSQKYLGKIPSNVNQKLRRGNFYLKIDQWPTLQTEIEFFSNFQVSFRILACKFLVYLAIPKVVSAISGLGAAMGDGFISLSVMFTSKHSG